MKNEKSKKKPAFAGFFFIKFGFIGEGDGRFFVKKPAKKL